MGCFTKGFTARTKAEISTPQARVSFLSRVQQVTHEYQADAPGEQRFFRDASMALGSSRVPLKMVMASVASLSTRLRP